MTPGRSCPLHYRYTAESLARAPDFRAQTLYVIGGLYGNVPALEAIQALAAAEPAPVTLAFNGDFNWFNIDDAGFRMINQTVLRHHALRGNVETELADDTSDAGCGCAYPDYVNADDVARSNEMIVQLRDTSRHHADLRTRLRSLPMNLVAQVGGERVALVHGDLESLAGWSLAQESLVNRDTKKIIKKQLVTTHCRIVASSHTCLPVAQILATALGDCVIFNNGAAGMPNFSGKPYGVITRVSTSAPAQASLYGTRVGGVHVDAMAVHYDHGRWETAFLANWPAGSAGYVSYFQRIQHGPSYTIDDANRLTVSRGQSARPTAVA